MKVVRSTSPGMRSRSLVSSLTVCSWGGRFMLSRVRLLMCCRGMSMYLHTCRRLPHISIAANLSYAAAAQLTAAGRYQAPKIIGPNTVQMQGF